MKQSYHDIQISMYGTLVTRSYTGRRLQPLSHACHFHDEYHHHVCFCVGKKQTCSVFWIAVWGLKDVGVHNTGRV